MRLAYRGRLPSVVSTGWSGTSAAGHEVVRDERRPD